MLKHRNSELMKKYLNIIILLAFIYACKDPYQENITPAYEYYPIATYMAMDSSFSQWVGLLQYTSLFNTMNLSADYTCFVPDDDAMNAYLQEKGVSAVDKLPLDEAIYLVKYHTIPGTEYSQSLFNNGVLADTTATGDYLSIEIREGGLNAIYVNGEARIKHPDVEATNGVIHVIDKVLTPVTQTIWEKTDAPAYTIFSEAVQKTGYAEMLNTIYQNESNGETGVVTRRKKYYTLFVVSDEIYKNYGITSVAGLAASLGETGSDYTSTSNALNRYVAYHILDQQLDFAALATFSDDATSKNIETVAPNELINISENNDELYINYDDETGTYATILVENISAKNGVIHEVSSPMTIITPPVTTVIWELTDYSDVASLFPDIYRKSTVPSTTTEYIEPGAVSCYSWAAIPSSFNDNSVAYMVAYKNDAVRYEMVNYDCLYLSLGLYGWIEMESPAIIKGTYKVEVSFYSIAATSESGKFLVIMDGNYLGSEIVTHGLSSTKSSIVKKTIGEVTFDETTTHTFRLLAGDDTGIYIDYIEFEPVNN